MEATVNKKDWEKPQIKALTIKNFTLGGAKTTSNENPKQIEFIPS